MKSLLLVVTILAALAVITVPATYAAGGIVPSECSSGLSGTCNLCKLFDLGKNFTQFLMFDLAIPIVILALVYGGFLIIMSGGDTKKVDEGRKVVTNAVIGTLIMFLAWVGINTIVMVLGVQFGADMGSTNWYSFPTCKTLNPIAGAIVPPPAGGENPPPPVGPGEYSDADARAALNSNVSVVSSGNCSDQTNARCTSLQGIPKDAITRINEIQANCGCHVTITGGTEVGHASHGISQPIVDFSYSDQVLDGIRSAGYTINAGFGRGATCEPAGSPGVKMACGPGAGHIHMEL